MIKKNHSRPRFIRGLTCIPQLIFAIFFLALSLPYSSVIGQNQKGKGTNKKVKKRWEFKTGDEIRSNPVISKGRVYVCSRDGKVYCLDVRDGKKKWVFTSGDSINSSPAIAGNRLFVASLDHNLYCLHSKTGELIWKFKTDNFIFSSPIVFDNRVYFGNKDGKLFCLDSRTGKKIWVYPSREFIRSSFAISKNHIVFGTNDGTIYCLNQDNGKKRWAFETGGTMYSTPVLDGERTFIPCGDLYCFQSRTGEVIWKKEIPGGGFSPAVAGDRVFAVPGGKTLFCYRREDGKQLWSYEATGEIRSPPAATAGRVFFGSTDNKLHCLNARTGKLRWKTSVGTSIFTSPALASGRLFVGNKDSNLYCFELDIQIAPTSWPMFRGGKSLRGTGPAPVLLKNNNRELLTKIKTLLQNRKFKSAKRSLRQWQGGNREFLPRMIKQIIRVFEEVHAEKYTEAITSWNNVSGDASSFPLQTKPFIHLIHRQSRFQDWLRSIGEDLGNKSLEKRKEATTSLKHAGVLAFPVLKKLKNSKNPEVSSRAKHLIQTCMMHWNNAFNR